MPRHESGNARRVSCATTKALSAESAGGPAAPAVSTRPDGTTAGDAHRGERLDPARRADRGHHDESVGVGRDGRRRGSAGRRSMPAGIRGRRCRSASDRRRACGWPRRRGPRSRWGWAPDRRRRARSTRAGSAELVAVAREGVDAAVRRAREHEVVEQGDARQRTVGNGILPRGAARCRGGGRAGKRIGVEPVAGRSRRGCPPRRRRR